MHPDIQVNASDSDGWTALHGACSLGKHLAVRLLLGHPAVQANVADDQGKTGLVMACHRGHAGVVQELLQHPGLDLDRVDDAVAIARRRGHSAVVALMEGHRAVRRARRARGMA